MSALTQTAEMPSVSLYVLALRKALQEGGGRRVATIDLDDRELRLLHAALHSYLDDFGHEEADLLREIKRLIARLPVPHDPGGGPPA